MSDIDDIISNPSGQEFTVDVGLSLIRLIKLGSENKVYLRSILKRQVEIQEILKGSVGQELDSNVKDKIDILEDNIAKVARDDFDKILHKVLK